MFVDALNKYPPLSAPSFGLILQSFGGYTIGNANVFSSANKFDVVTYAHYACVADCADAMADAWEDTAGCAQAICLHENLLE